MGLERERIFQETGGEGCIGRVGLEQGGGTGGEGLHSPRERKDVLGRSGSEAAWVVGLQRVEWLGSEAEPGQPVYWA